MSIRTRTTAALLTGALAIGGVAGTVAAHGGGSSSSSSSTPSVAGCLTAKSMSNSVGYYTVYAAVWTNIAVDNACGNPGSWQLVFTNSATNIVEYTQSGTVGTGGYNGTIDYDWAKFRSDYRVELQIKDSSGNSASKVLFATTPRQKSNG